MLRTKMAGQTLLISLKSWRYILLVSLLAYMLVGLLLTYRTTFMASSFSLIAGFITLFYCWRLWMDEQFFALLYQHSAETAAFDQAISTLWGKDLKSRSLEERWAGAKRLIIRAWLFVALQWCGVLVMLVVGLKGI